MRKNVRCYVWKEHLFSASGVPDYELKILGKTTAEYNAEKFGAEIVEEFPVYREGEISVILRSSYTCLPKTGIEGLVSQAATEGKNIFFGAGWILVEPTDRAEAKYSPLRAGAALLSPADYPFVTECIRREILKKLLRHGVTIESTSGVYVDSTSFIESGARLSHDVTVTGKSLIRKGAFLLPYTVVDGGEVGEYACVGPFAYLASGGFVPPYTSFSPKKQIGIAEKTSS